MFHFHISFRSLSPPFMRSADMPMAIISHFTFVTANFGKITLPRLSEAGLPAKENIPSLLQLIIICWDIS